MRLLRGLSVPIAHPSRKQFRVFKHVAWCIASRQHVKADGALARLPEASGPVLCRERGTCAAAAAAGCGAHVARRQRDARYGLGQHQGQRRRERAATAAAGTDAQPQRRRPLFWRTLRQGGGGARAAQGQPAVPRRPRRHHPGRRRMRLPQRVIAACRIVAMNHGTDGWMHAGSGLGRGGALAGATILAQQCRPASHSGCHLTAAYPRRSQAGVQAVVVPAAVLGARLELPRPSAAGQPAGSRQHPAWHRHR